VLTDLTDLFVGVNAGILSRKTFSVMVIMCLVTTFMVKYIILVMHASLITSTAYLILMKILSVPISTDLSSGKLYLPCAPPDTSE
jgi:hypothetical protein